MTTEQTSAQLTTGMRILIVGERYDTFDPQRGLGTTLAYALGGLATLPPEGHEHADYDLVEIALRAGRADLVIAMLEPTRAAHEPDAEDPCRLGPKCAIAIATALNYGRQLLVLAPFVRYDRMVGATIRQLEAIEDDAERLARIKAATVRLVDDVGAPIDLPLHKLTMGLDVVVHAMMMTLAAKATLAAAAAGVQPYADQETTSSADQLTVGADKATAGADEAVDASPTSAGAGTTPAGEAS